MELTGETYLFNLSIVAMTFAAVSVLVMLIRQTMGGKLSNFDVHLISSYVAGGFVIAIDAILPPLAALHELEPSLLWPITSAIAAILLAGVTISAHTRRREATGHGMPPAVLLSFSLHWLAVALLIVNAAVPAVQGVGLFASAITLEMAVMFWTFTRRVTSLFGTEIGSDWDPKRG